MATRTCTDTSERIEGEEEVFEYDIAKKKRVAFTGGSQMGVCSIGGSTRTQCQAQGCEADLTNVKRYYRRHKVCEVHSKSVAVIVAGMHQRFCQQCSKFHELSEFDHTKRSCRRRLAGHNERRRKSSIESPGEGSSSHRKSGVVILG